MYNLHRINSVNDYCETFLNPSYRLIKRLRTLLSNYLCSQSLIKDYS